MSRYTNSLCNCMEYKLLGHDIVVPLPCKDKVPEAIARRAPLEESASALSSESRAFQVALKGRSESALLPLKAIALSSHCPRQSLTRRSHLRRGSSKTKASFLCKERGFVVEELPWHRAIFPWGLPQSIFAAATFHNPSSGWSRCGSIAPKAPGKLFSGKS